MWATTVTGRKMPVNARPAEGGNVRLVPLANGNYEAQVLGRGEDPRPGEVLRMAHFATCPYRNAPAQPTTTEDPEAPRLQPGLTLEEDR